MAPGKKFFGDTYQDDGATSGLSFVGREEKEVLIKESTTITPSRVFLTASQYGPQYILVFELDGDERALGFKQDSGVFTRDAMLGALADYLEEPDAEPVHLKIERSGQAIVLVNADGEGANA